LSGFPTQHPLKKLTFFVQRGAERWLPALIQLPLLPGLQELALKNTDLTDQGAQLIWDNRDRFSHLKRFQVESRDLTEMGRDLLAPLCTEVRPITARFWID
jgi:hypothetical protein